MIYLLQKSTGKCECIYNIVRNANIKEWIEANQKLADSLGCFLFSIPEGSKLERNICSIPASVYYAFIELSKPLSDFEKKEEELG